MQKFFQDPARRTVTLIWLGWAILLLGYQAYLPARLELTRPDYAIEWTPQETRAGAQADKLYLSEPFLNTHVSWDSEFYLGIALEGYHSDNIRRVNGTFDDAVLGFWPFTPPAASQPGDRLSMSQAFFPMYPLAIRALSLPLGVLGMNPIATATLSAVGISLLGALAGMLALYELAKDELGEDGGLRAAFYLVIFPSGFFLAQVYTEGLFVGLAFWALLLARRGQLGWAAILAVLATYTRAVGVLLAVPMFYAWFRSGAWSELAQRFSWSAIRGLLLATVPLLAFGLWRISYYGQAFTIVEDVWFGRGLLAWDKTFYNWGVVLDILRAGVSQSSAYYSLELAGILFGFVACIVGLRRHPDLALFGLLAVFLSFTSGQAQGMYRYVLVAPSVFLLLARAGKHAAFDRSWSMLSLLLMSIMAALFSFDLWAG
ncbi:MAG: hypothetical protein KIS88_01050 [Anaerolineales bacterium]|nr:hypothetical protein [Anaerolineales bacterium]